VQIRRIEWPTIGLAAFIYGGWAALTFFQAELPPAFTALLGAWLIAWQSSLQHELLHGHPTPCPHINHAIAFAPLSLWLPYDVYRTSHLAHHRAETLTDPVQDPESFYWRDEDFGSLGSLGRRVVCWQTTLAGRLILGPAWAAGSLFAREFAGARKNPRGALTVWGAHIVGCAAVLIWIVGVCKMSPWFYLFGIVYPGASLSLIRSFAEHRAAGAASERTAIVENAMILGPLFLFNNLHLVHHARPALPWYRIPGWYREHRAELIAANGGRVYDGYFEIARRFLFKPHDAPVHPFIS
jgi:fatty acid desaturase